MRDKVKNTRNFVLVLAVLCCVFKSNAQHYFDNRITVPADLPAPVMDAVKDMAYWLEKSTSRPFTVRQSDRAALQKSIQLVWADRSDLPTEIKEQLNRDGQSFYLAVDDKKGVRIAGTGTNSFNNGIYTFLQELGFRWYMPGDSWAIVPKSFKGNIRLNRIYTPDFQGRFYAGTGGVNAIPGIDPDNNFRKDFTIWNKRNRFGHDYAIKGHSGHLFYRSNKKILDANPLWFCNGKINGFGRVDISFPEVVRLFTKWALGQVNPEDRFPTIGIDPSDGAGGKDDCLPTNIAEIKTWSDKYFWLANQVAAQLAKGDTKTQVQLYAYSTHSAPPSFPLKDNIYPIIIPYAFQNVSSPEGFIEIWQKKMNGRPMGMYDYWNITQWSSAIPQFNIYSIPEKLWLWKKNNITSINIESTNSKGPMGHAFWLASQMMWNTNLSFDSLYSDFLLSCFGPAANDVKKMYDRWSQNYQEEMEVNLSLQDLKHASEKTRDPEILNRLAELKAYVHYIKLYYEYKASPSSAEAYEKLIGYIQAIHDLRLVQSSALLERYIKAPKNYRAATGRKIAAKSSTLNIERQFRQDIKEHSETYTISNFKFDIRKAVPIKDEKPANPRYLNGRNSYRFYLPVAKDFEIKVGTNKETKMVITGDSKTWFEKMIPAGKDNYYTIKVRLQGGHYTLDFGEFARFSRIIFPTDIVFISSGISYYDNAGFPIHYVYVPNDVSEIVYQDDLGPGINRRGYWLDPDGKKIEAQKIKDKVYRVKVPEKNRGRVWTLVIGHRSFKMLNIPNTFSIRKFDYSDN